MSRRLLDEVQHLTFKERASSFALRGLYLDMLNSCPCYEACREVHGAHHIVRSRSLLEGHASASLGAAARTGMLRGGVHRAVMAPSRSNFAPRAASIVRLDCFSSSTLAAVEAPSAPPPPGPPNRGAVLRAMLPT